MSGSRHTTSSQDLESSLTLSFDSSYKSPSCSAKTSKSSISSKGMANLGSGISEPKSLVRKYIHHSSLIPEIPYIFRHHNMSDGDTSQFMEDYRNCYTFPNIDERSKKIGSVICAGPSVSTIRPTLFMLSGGHTSYQPKDTWQPQVPTVLVLDNTRTI